MCWYHCAASVCCLFDVRRNREMGYLLSHRFRKSDLWHHFVFSVFINVNCNQHGQTPNPVVGLKIQTYCNYEKSVYKCNCNVDSLRFSWRSKLLFSFPYIRLVYVYNYFSMCSHLKSVLYQNFLYITRKAISCSRRRFSKKTEPVNESWTLAWEKIIMANWNILVRAKAYHYCTTEYLPIIKRDGSRKPLIRFNFNAKIHGEGSIVSSAEETVSGLSLDLL